MSLPASALGINAPFPEKLKCLFEPKRTKVLFGGRGAGRSWGVARALLLMGTQRPIRVLCAREFQNSITDSVHKLLSDQIEGMGLGKFYEIQNARIVGKNGTSFAFEGIKNNISRIKSYEGIDYCWVEEAVKVSRNSWSVLLPTIRKEGSEVWLTFNPELETDYTYQRFTKPNLEVEGPISRFGDGSWEGKNTVVVKMTWRDNPFFPQTLKTEMDADKRRDHDLYLNVWEGFCRQILEGVIYAKELRKAQAENRVCSVPYDKSVPVSVAWDLGRADNTALWFFQRVAMQWRMLAYYEASGEDISHFLRELQRRPYVYAEMNLPHDAYAKRLGTKLSIEEQIRAAGYRTHKVPQLSLVDGINAARLVLGSVYFDEEKCADGLTALRRYRYKVVDGQYSNLPLHDQYSDGADAFRYFALVSNERKRDGGVLERLERAGDTARKMFERDNSNRGNTGTGWMR